MAWRAVEQSRDQRVTMRMVAEACGVHASTVSRALRRAESGHAAANETDARIRRVAAELHYVVNPNASSLKTKRSHTLGVLVPSLTDTTLAAIYDAAERTAKAHGFETFVVNTHDDPTEQDRRIRLLAGRQVDGLLVGDARTDGSNLAALRRTGIPFVLVLRRSEGHTSVTGDDRRGGWLAAQHLLDLGHRRIGVVAGPRWASTSTDRVDGFRAGLAEGGVELGEDLVVQAGFEVGSGRAGAALLLARPDPPTAVFAVNDVSAIGVLGQLRANGLRPGSDVAVVGYNDLPLAAELTVPLTTLRNPLDELGRIAIERLLDLMAGRVVDSTVLPPRLMVRESTVP